MALAAAMATVAADTNDTVNNPKIEVVSDGRGSVAAGPRSFHKFMQPKSAFWGSPLWNPLNWTPACASQIIARGGQ